MIDDSLTVFHGTRSQLLKRLASGCDGPLGASELTKAFTRRSLTTATINVGCTMFAVQATAAADLGQYLGDNAAYQVFANLHDQASFWR
jgi:hypothetical protein